MNNNGNTKLTAKEVIITLLFFAVIVFGVLIFGGTITCGFHFVDDGDFLQIYSYLHEEGKSYMEAVWMKLSRDFTTRFRPLYYPLRVFMVKIFGLNLIAFSIIKGIETVLAHLMIYCCARKLNFNKKLSVAVAFFIMLGPQSAIWWKLGPQELMGVLLLTTSLFLQLKYFEKRKNIYNIVALLGYTLLSLYKETFIFLLPIAGMVYLIGEQRSLCIEGSKLKIYDIVSFLKRHYISIIYLLVLFLAEFYVFAFVIGLDKVGYAGIDGTMSLYDYCVVLFNDLRMPLRVGSYALFATITSILCFKNYKKIKKIKLEFILALYIILSQMVIHAKTGLEERYVMPWVIGVCYLFVILVIKEQFIEVKRQRIFRLTLIIFLVFQFALVIKEATYYTYRGRSITKMWNMVDEITVPEDIIVTAYAPYYESDETSAMWFQLQGKENVYAYRDNKCVDIYGKNEGRTVDIKNADVILFYHPSDRHFIEQPDIDLSDYNVERVGSVCIAEHR